MAKFTIGDQRKKAARDVWDSIKTPEAWAALTAAQKWEIVRRVLAYLLKREFSGLD